MSKVKVNDDSKHTDKRVAQTFIVTVHSTQFYEKQFTGSIQMTRY